MVLMFSSDLHKRRPRLLHLAVLLLQQVLITPHPQALPQLNNKPSDTDALTIFRYKADAHGNLAVNWSTADACKGCWRGVGCSSTGRVISLSLPSLDLRGPLDALSYLDQLRLLDLHDNRLNGTLLTLFPSLTNLKHLYLSHNDLSGPVPPSVSLLKRILRLDLSDNDFSGPIPANSLANLTGLVSLRMQNNLLSGLVPDLSIVLPRLVEFNISNNELYGRVPDGMHNKFGPTSFKGNAGLCGPDPPLPVCSFRPQEPPSSSSQVVVPSNPSSMPDSSTAVDEQGRGRMFRGGKRGLSTGAIIVIVVGNTLFLLVVVSLVAYCCARRFDGGREDDKRDKGQDEGGGSHSTEERGKGDDRDSGDSGATLAAQSKLVFFEGEETGSEGSGRWRRCRPFELEDLLRASAEMVGKGTLGTVYRAVLEDGCMVAVKRLRDANPCLRKEFHSYMGIIGRLRHPNLVNLRAYYYAKQEKLLIYDYLPNGSLYTLLHGNRGDGILPLDWTTRISLVLGAARGLACIHAEYASSKIPHGNIKSSNVLLNKNGVACISDFGLALLLNPTHTTSRLGGYRAPEQAESKRLSQEADIYAFGVLLLEVLTGRAPTQNSSPIAGRGGSLISTKLPEWVKSVVREGWTGEVFDVELKRYKNIEGEMVAMLHVALACVSQQPDMRPGMSDVVKMIEEIRVEQSPLTEDIDEPRASLSNSLATATTEEGRLSN
ncbi:hypothetical protein J5N97_012258 [Dioscorea zingiberensis]|uniref:Protein kinase domain-containing protein n=1 Tax=Dioscorea zingiberensis TaxID=325984 RepID=A0A9D5CPE5_9LILI|nr:hypothetical protein J5N97_012258 [Dioscorea zingiberensis]